LTAPLRSTSLPIPAPHFASAHLVLRLHYLEKPHPLQTLLIPTIRPIPRPPDLSSSFNLAPAAPSSSDFFLLITQVRPDPTPQVVGGAGSGLTAGLQSPLQSRGRGGGRGHSLQAHARFCLPSRLPSRMPRRVPSLTSTLRGTRECGLEGILEGRRVHVDEASCAPHSACSAVGNPRCLRTLIAFQRSAGCC